MKLSNSNRRKWMRTYWKDAKGFVNQYALVIILVITICCLLGYVSARNKAQQEYIRTLEDANRTLIDEELQLLESNVLMEETIDELFEENQKFGSMFAEIENEPGGHEMLKKLYNQVNQ
jgi:hypothetical protein